MYAKEKNQLTASIKNIITNTKRKSLGQKISPQWGKKNPQAFKLPETQKGNIDYV